jgi:pyruvate-ferredoxin/flavodoxin oxidoreductase
MGLGYKAVQAKVAAQLKDWAATDEAKAAVEAWEASLNDADESKKTAAALIALLEADGSDAAKAILADKAYLTKKSFWIFGGDGWAYDIGFGGLDHVLASGNNVNVFVFDTEVYSNTGGQASKASNIGQVAQFAAAGKETKKKSLAEIAMSYGYVYVAQVAMGANPAQTLKAIAEAEAYDGPSLIIGYSPCEMHSIKKGGMMHCQEEMKKAVECGYWNLFRFNPAADEGKQFTLDSKEPKGGYQEFLMNEARYSRLTREFPERATELFERNEKNAQDRYKHLLKLKEMYSA